MANQHHLKHDSAKNQPFLRRPTAQTHRLDFSITASSRNTNVRGHSATNSSNNNNNNSGNLDGRRTGSALLFHPATTSTTSASRTTKAVAEQAPTPPESLTVQPPRESPKATVPLDNTSATAPKIRVPFFPVSDVPLLAMQQQQHTSLRTSSARSSKLTYPVNTGSSVPELSSKPDGADFTFASQILEPASYRHREMADMKTVPDTSVQSSACVMDNTTKTTHDHTPKQEKESPTMIQRTRSSLSVMPLPVASVSNMSRNHRREDRSSSTSRPVHSYILQEESVDFTDISAMLMDRTVIKQRWIEAERQRFRLVDELRMRVKEESEKYQSTAQEVCAMTVSINALQTQNFRLKADVARLEAQVTESQARIQGIDTDRKKQAETHEAHRGQMAAHLDSIKQDSVKASVALEGLVTDKARWEADLAALRTSMQDMECDRGHLRTSHHNLLESFSECSSQLKTIQADHGKDQEISQNQQEEIKQYRTRCESLSDQLRQQSERIGELDREIEEGRVAFEAMQVTNSFMSDHIDFLERASEYQQSILTSQLRNVEERCQKACLDELNKVKDEFAETKNRAVKEIAALESNIEEGTMKTESLTTRNLQLEAELSAIKEDSTGYMDTIVILQEAKRKLEDENQHLIQSSMDAQADYAIEVNNAQERFEELRQRESRENQAMIQSKDDRIVELNRQLEELADEKQQLSNLVDYQAKSAAATDREMLELRVKIQLLQTDNDFLNKLRDDLKKELETLQVQQLQQQPMPLTDIARLHSRDREGGSSSVMDFLRWPVELGTPPTAKSSSVASAGVSPRTVGERVCTPSPSVAARTGSARTTLTDAATAAAISRSPRSRVTTITVATSSPSSTAVPAAAAGVVPGTQSSNSSGVRKRAATGALSEGGGGGGSKRSLKRKRTANEPEPREIGDGGGVSEFSDQDDDHEAPGLNTSASGGAGTSTCTSAITRRQRTRRQAQQQRQSHLQPGSSSLSSNTATVAAAKKSSRGK